MVQKKFWSNKKDIAFAFVCEITLCKCTLTAAKATAAAAKVMVSAQYSNEGADLYKRKQLISLDLMAAH